MIGTKRRWLVAAALLIPLLVILLLGKLWLPFAGAGLARILIVEEPLDSADAIFVLGSQRMSRTLEAGALHQSSLAPLIVLSSNETPHSDAVLRQLGVRLPSFRQLQVSALMQMGVPIEQVRWLGAQPANTFEEARAIAAVARQRGWSRVLVVTTAYHTRRSDCYFRREETPGLQFVIRRSRFEAVHPDRWWTEPGERIDVLLEYAKLPALVMTRLFRRADQGEAPPLRPAMTPDPVYDPAHPASTGDAVWPRR